MRRWIAALLLLLTLSLAAPPALAAQESERCFAETGYCISGRIREYWEQNGGLAVFGLPLGPQQALTTEGGAIQAQWFERHRLELHPENPAPYDVLLGRLGAELGGGAGGGGQPAGLALEQGTWLLEGFGPVDAPQPPATSGRPTTIRFEGGQVSGSTGCNGFGGSYQATASAITFGNLIGTLIACEEPLAQQEQVIFSALRGEAPYTIADGRLRISYDEGRQALVYRAAVVSGTVTYRQRIALPPQAVIQVQLVDVSLADAPATVLSTVTIEAAGRQVPFAFELPYDPAQIDERNSYAVQARITVDGQLRFISTMRYAVLTQGNPATVEVVVNPA